MLGRLSRSNSQYCLHEEEQNVSSVPKIRNTEHPSHSNAEQLEITKLDPIIAASIQFTKEHPIGAILVKLATDNTALAKKSKTKRGRNKHK